MPYAKSQFLEKYGPWALITGASSGIGEALAFDLAERGINLVLVARRSEKLAEISQTLCVTSKIELRTLTADLSKESDVRYVLEEIASLEIGLYMASAGFGTAGHFTENEADIELNMIDVNCRALAALAHPLAVDMRDRGRGGLIFLSSIVAFQGVANSANYAATKAYVQTLAEGLAIELAPNGVDVVASAPGPVATGFSSRAGMQMGGAAQADEVARLTLAALGRACTIRPGFKSKLLGYGLGTLPRRVRTAILTQVMAGMIKHRNGKTTT